MKLYDSTQIKSILADKYAVREWVKERIGDQYLIPLIGVWDDFDEIDFDAMPDRFVLKATHGSGMNIIVTPDKPLDKKCIKKKITLWKRTYYGIGPMQEWHYMNIPHRVVAEKYIENIEGDLYDYKFYCFNGVAKYIQVIKGRSTQTQMAFYNLKWEKMGFTHIHFSEMQEDVERPNQLDRAIEM